MARGQIIVESSQLDAAAQRVEGLATTYESEYTSLFGTVGDLSNSWSGEDNQAFTQQIEGFRDDFTRMTQLMRDYAAYLRKTAAAYRETQDSVAAGSKNLSQGS